MMKVSQRKTTTRKKRSGNKRKIELAESQALVVVTVCGTFFHVSIILKYPDVPTGEPDAALKLPSYPTSRNRHWKGVGAKVACLG